MRAKSTLFIFAILLLVTFASAQHPTTLALKGKVVNRTSGAGISSGNLIVNVTTSTGTLIYNETFVNAVQSGIYDVLLGRYSSNPLNLSYNTDYNVSLAVVTGSTIYAFAESVRFRGGQGEIADEDIVNNITIATPANITTTGNLSLGQRILFGLGAFIDNVVTGFINIGGGLNVTNGLNVSNGLIVDSGKVGIGTTSPETTLHVIGNANISNGLNVSNGLSVKSGSVGIGTSDPGSKLTVIGDLNVTGTSYLGTTTITADNITTNQLVSKSGNISFFNTSKNELVTIVGEGPGSGRVGIGTTSPETTLSVVGSVNISAGLNVSGQCVTGDTLLDIVELDEGVEASSSAMDDNKKIKTQSSIVGGFCQGDCNTKKVKIVDVKPGQYVLSLNQETGRIEPHMIKGLLDMGIQPVFNLTTEDGRSVRTTGNHPYLTKEGWVKVTELNEDVDIAVLNYNPSSLTKSEVENTLTLSCFFNALSSDQIPQLYLSAAAKYCTSSGSGLIESASFRKCFNSEEGITSILSSNTNKNLTKSSDVLCVFNNNLSLYFLSSERINSGVINSTLSEAIISAVLPSLIAAENNALASTTNSIYIPLYFLDTALLTFLPNSKASCSVNSLSDPKYFKKANCFAFFDIATLATLDQSIPSNLSITSLTSSGTDTDIIAILTSPLKANDGDYINVLNSQIKFMKIKSIQYVGEEQVYDIEVEGTHNFIANGIVAHNTHIKDKVGIGTTSPETTLSVVGNANISNGLNVSNGLSVKSGNVGIGTTDPGSKLTVIGDLNVTGTSYLGTTTITADNITTDEIVSKDGNITFYNTTKSAVVTIVGEGPGFGRVGIGTTSPETTLSVVGSVNISAGLNVSGQCVTGDTLLDIVELDSNEEIGHSSLMMEDDNVIDDSSEIIFNQPSSGQGNFCQEGNSLVSYKIKKVKIKEVKAGDYVLSLNEETSRIEPHKIIGLLDMGIQPIYELTTESGRSINTTGNHPYLTKHGWIRVTQLREGDAIAVPYYDAFKPNSEPNNCFGDTTLSLCAFNRPLSPDIIEQLRARDKATYGASLSCGANFMASGKNTENSLDGMNVISLTKKSYASLYSCSDNFVNLSMSDLFFAASSNKNSGATNSNLLRIELNENTEKVTPLFIKEDITTFASTTNLSGIPYLLECNLSYLLAKDTLTLSANASACACVSFDFETAFLNLTSLESLSFNTLLTSIETSTSGTLLNSDSNSLGISTFNSAIISPDDSITECYKNLLFSDILFDRITSIRILEPQQVYDIEVEGTHNFIANGIVAHNTHIKDKVGIGTTAPETTLHVVGNANISNGLNVSNGLAVKSGNVGIGTADPGSKLTLIGDLNVTGTSYLGRVTISSDNITTDEIVSKDGNITFYNTTKNALVTVVGEGPGYGRVGIGTTGPDQKLHLSVSSGNVAQHISSGTKDSHWAIAGVAGQFSDIAAAGDAVLRSDDGDLILEARGSGNIIFTTGYPDSAKVKILNTGNFGINHTNPQAKLHVNGTGYFEGKVGIGQGNYAPETTLSVLGNANISNGLNVTNGLAVASGSVGIGTADPGSKLTVIGDLNVTGTSYLGTTTITADNITTDEIVSKDGNITFYNTTKNALVTVVGEGPGYGRVGIGTTAPGAKLHIAQSVDSNAGGLEISNIAVTRTARLWVDVANNVRLDGGSAADGVISLNAGGTGNVGIGTTTPGATLEVQGGGNFSGGLNVSKGLTVRTGNVGIGTADPGSKLTVIGDLNVTGTSYLGTTTITADNITTDEIVSKDGNITFYNTTKNALVTVVGEGPGYGRVGIGTMNPTTALQISDSVTNYNFDVGGNPLFTLAYNGVTTELQSFTTSSFIGTQSNHDFGIETNNIDRIHITGAGNVGIGTNSPLSTLHVVTDDSANTTTTNILYLDHTISTTSNGTTGIGAGILFRADNNISTVTNISQIAGILTDAGNSTEASAITFSTRTAGGGLTERVRIDGSGKVGIGTTSPETTLYVVGNANISNGLNVSNGLAVKSGSVGIGTTTPNQPLQVIGNANITGNLYLSGSLYGNGSDIAENYPSAEVLEPGDVVVVDETNNGHITKSAEAYDTKVIGIISTAPSQIIGSEGNGYPVALSGRVPTKATNENGNIEPGDLLTTSGIKGHAMKCDDKLKCLGAVIGKALEPCSNQTCTIKVFVTIQ